MPSDFLLPLFALTLLANAVLVAVAIRGLRRGRFDAAPPLTPLMSSDRPLTDDLQRAIAARRAILDEAPAPAERPSPAPSGPTSPSPVPVPIPSEAAAPPRDQPAASPTPGAPGTPGSPGSPAARAVRRRRSATITTATTTATGKPRPKGNATDEAIPTARARGGRRKFALPPMDDDHDKVSRSIETFLSGGEGVDEPPPSDAAAAGATTVALIAVDGLPARPRRTKANRSVVDEDAVTSALAMVERTIRGAARGTDLVSAVDRGRFRIVLPGTGELAARAYLRRIRVTVEPLLESAEHPLRLAVATATVLDEPVADAVRRADRRLAAALAAAKTPKSLPEAADPEVTDADAANSEPQPRAAAD